MSQFLSRKYLAYRRAAAGGLIDEDLPCRQCGYNLRGLNYGRACPECGAPAGFREPLQDALLESTEAERLQWRRGLALATACVAVAVVARFAYFLAAAPGALPGLTEGYIAVGALNSVVWIFAVWLVTPPSLDERWHWMRRPRVAARVFAVMWLPGYACLFTRYVSSITGRAEDVLLMVDTVGRLTGGIGVLCVAFILSWIAEEAELTKPAWRLNVVVWTLWFPTLLAQAFPSGVAWFTLIILGMVLFFWGWVMMLLLLGLRGLHQHLLWAERHAAEGIGRVERITARRREMDEALEKTIRPLPDRPEEG